MPESSPTPRNPLFVGAEAAMHRAAKHAREVARRTGTGIAYLREGEIVEEYPVTELADRVAEDEPSPDDTPPASQ